ncbi:MAG: FkbM family methyltransferase [Rhodospirillaceae bacterium]
MRIGFLERTALARPLREAGFRLWDIGARGGIDPHFAPFAFSIDAVGFEPDPAAFRLLVPSGRWRSERFFETAIAGTTGPGILNIPEDPAGASLLEHDPAVGDRYGLGALFDVRHRLAIDTRTMDDAVRTLGVPPPNLLKLDVEGLELAILEGGLPQLGGVVAVKLEAAFLRHRRNQPLVGDLVAFMEVQGFCLMDIVDQARWRTRPWAADPYVVKRDPAYSRGRLVQADLVFLREPDTVTASTAFSAALAAMGLGYFDHGLELLAAAGDADGGERRAEDIRKAVPQAARAYGRARARAELRGLPMHAVRLVRSLAGGLNAPPGTDAGRKVG